MMCMFSCQYPTHGTDWRETVSVLNLNDREVPVPCTGSGFHSKFSFWKFNISTIVGSSGSMLSIVLFNPSDINL